MSVLPGDIVQITNADHHWFPCLAVVSELKAFGVQAFVFMPTNDGSGSGEAYVRLKTEDFEAVGARCIILSASTVEARDEALTTLRGSEGSTT